jgi:hypothetical protein
VEESPGEGSDVVEELDGGFGSGGVDGGCTEEDLQVGIDFFGGSVRDAEVMISISTGSPRTLGKICRNR